LIFFSYFFSFFFKNLFQDNLFKQPALSSASGIMISEKTRPNTKEELLDILNPLVKRWFFRRFKEFSLPQLYGVMDIHCRKNVLVSAPTGATKTLTAFLSILNELVDSAQKGRLEDKVYCIYISPLKALNYDIEVNLITPLKEIEEIAGKKLGIRVGVRTGDTTQSEKSGMLKKPPHILITTPESLAIVLSSVKFKDHLATAEWVVVDEVHALAENKRGVHLSLSLERLQALSPGICRVGLSATVAPIDEVAKFLAGYSTDASGSAKNQESRDCGIINVQFIKELDLKVLSPVPNLINVSYEQKHTAMYKLVHELVQEHKTTLIFTNTRAATERVVNYLKEKHPSQYTENIGAHHGSLSKELRHNLEKRLREGKLKVVVSSTSLELGIDIGYIDLVILLGSPKSVARALQRTGRSGHKLHDKTKGRIIVLDRDDLVECAVLMKNAIEKKIDKINIPKNCLDVLAQQIYGIAIDGQIHADSLFALVRQSYCYNTLTRHDFNLVIDYLAGKYLGLESRHVYAKIWYDEETGMIGRKGKLARVLYMTNIGTIPDETFITVKVGTQSIGRIDEGFLERLRRGDVFVLGGEKYEFLFAKGTVAYANASVYRPPTIPSWVSEMLPLSFDLANDISRLRRLMDDKFAHSKKKSEIMEFLRDYLYLDGNAASSVYEYMKEQFLYSKIPHDKRMIIEHYNDGRKNMYLFHSLYGRRVNDALSRAFAYAISRIHLKDVEINVTDTGFYIASDSKLNIEEAVKVVEKSSLDELLRLAIDKTEVLRRRFRHCATRSLMILRNYMGRTKHVGRQQVSSMLLMNAVQQIKGEFPILKEARREVLDDLMDRKNAEKVVEMLREGKVKIEYITTVIPTPFAFNLVLEGQLDVLRIEDKTEFLKRMHQMVLAKISLKKVKGAKELVEEEFSYEKEWDRLHELEKTKKEEKN
jgi:ATP-dependent helicase Lhr and Lhr-like helicase